MTVLGYSAQRVVLHWLSAAVILWALASGFYVAGSQVSAETRQWVGFFNVSLTTVFIPFFVWRLVIFIAHARHQGMRTFTFLELLALLAHVLLYLVISVVLVTGVLMMDRPIDVFALIQFAQPLDDPELISLFVTIHVWACVVLSLLIALHVAAVIVHEACGHRLVRRMSFCSYRRSERLE